MSEFLFAFFRPVRVVVITRSCSSISSGVYTRTENTFPKIIGTVGPWQLNKRRQITAYNLGIVVRATSFIIRIWRSVGGGLSSVVYMFRNESTEKPLCGY